MSHLLAASAKWKKSSKKRKSGGTEGAPLLQLLLCSLILQSAACDVTASFRNAKPCVLHRASPLRF
jgi:hypothetical protein